MAVKFHPTMSSAAGHRAPVRAPARRAFAPIPFAPRANAAPADTPKLLPRFGDVAIARRAHLEQPDFSLVPDLRLNRRPLEDRNESEDESKDTSSKAGTGTFTRKTQTNVNFREYEKAYGGQSKDKNKKKKDENTSRKSGEGKGKSKNKPTHQATLTLVDKKKTYGDERKRKVETDLGKMGKASAEGELGTAELAAGGTATWDPSKGLAVGGNASAKVTLVGGNAKIETAPLAFQLFGENLRASFTAGVSAGVLAEAQGSIEVNLVKGAKNAAIEVGPGNRSQRASASVSAFAGAKAGVEIGARLDWEKQQDYSVALHDWIKEILTEHVPAKVVEWLPDNGIAEAADYTANILFGAGGWHNLAALKAGVEGSAGIGGEASFHLGLAGGRIHTKGSLKGTLGLGLGTQIALDIDAINGLRFLSLARFKNAESIVSAFGYSASTIQKHHAQKAQLARRYLGKLIYDYGTGKRGIIDLLIKDSLAKRLAGNLGYTP